MDKEFIEYRQNLVGRYHLQGKSTREIAQALIDDGCVNPDTGEKFSHGTIATDLQEIKKIWESRSFDNMISYKNKKYEELEEIIKVSWQKGDLRMALAAIQAQVKLLGLDAPQKVETTYNFTPDAKQQILQKLEQLRI